jgi:hypothetical protein
MNERAHGSERFIRARAAAGISHLASGSDAIRPRLETFADGVIEEAQIWRESHHFAQGAQLPARPRRGGKRV